jgi:hypothetical protein
MSSTIFFVALVIRVSNNLVMTNVNTNTNVPNINIPTASIEPMYHMKRNVAAAPISPKRLGESNTDEARAMARINEITKEVLNPMAIMLAYKKGERDFSLSNYFSGEEGEIFLSSNTIYKERLPFNLLQTEYEQLTDRSRVFGTFLQSEL